jgi:hypothetical protein
VTVSALVCPGSTVNRLYDADRASGVTPNFQKSPSGELAVGSNASVVPRIVTVEVAPAGLPAPNGPISDGTANLKPTVRPENTPT